jgi:hypothetical protein
MEKENSTGGTMNNLQLQIIYLDLEQVIDKDP